jgi:ketosteroid isomerase-like protein
MSDSSTQSEVVVRKFFELLNAEDLEGIRALLSEEAAWCRRRVTCPGAGEYRGRDVIVDTFLKPIRGLFAKGSRNRILHGLQGLAGAW